MARTTRDFGADRDEREGASPEAGRAGRAGPGGDADRPGEIPPRGLFQVLKRVKREAKKDNISLLAGGVAFFALLAIVPLLVAALSIWGLFANAHDATRVINDFASGLPHSAQQLISQQLRSIANRSSAGLGITAVVSIVVALWSASSGTKHLIEAVNAAYDEEEDRGFVKVRAIALAFTFGAIVVGFVALGLIAILPSALADAGVPHTVRVVADAAVWPLLGILMIVALAVVYRVAPDRREARWHWVSWGAVAATALWLIGSALFALYSSNLGSYDKTYGSLGGVVVLMLWLYITALVIILGAELNAELEQQTVHDTTVGEPRPLGERRAEAADTVEQA